MLNVTDLESWEYESGGITLRGWMTPNCGNNGRPVIHFLHGTGLPGLSYWPFLRHFSKEFDLFINSVEGHGGSDHLPRHQYSDWQALMRRSLAAFESHRERWDLSQPVIGMAHSFGAISTILMIHHQVKPFHQYLLLDPVIYPKSLISLMRFLHMVGAQNYLPHVKQAKTRRSSWPSRNAVKDNLYGRGVFKHWTEEALDSYIEHGVEPTKEGDWALKCPSWLEARIFSGYPKRLWPAIAKLPENTWIIYCNKTYAFIPPAVKKAEKANPHVHLAQIEGGHCFMHEKPEESFELVRKLIKLP